MKTLIAFVSLPSKPILFFIHTLTASARGILQHVLGALPLATSDDLQLRRMRTGRVYVSQLDGLLPLEEQPAGAMTMHARRLRAEFLQRWCTDADPMCNATITNSFLQKQRGWIYVRLRAVYSECELTEVLARFVD